MHSDRVSLAKKQVTKKYVLKNIGCFFKSPIFTLVIVLFIAIGFRAYKAHYTGIIHDEVWTYTDYCKDIHSAVTVFKSTNNHVLNSIFIVLTKKVLGGYEHFIRIPAVLFGALFCCAITYIVHKTIRSWALKTIILLLILFNWFIVDLTYLGRGYAIALGASFTGIAVLIHLSSKPPSPPRLNWHIVFFLIAMNFLAMGSMLSSFSIVLTLNIAFVILIIADSIKLGKKELINAALRISTIALGSAASLYLLYRHVYSDIIKLSKLPLNMKSFFGYIKQVLQDTMIYFDHSRIQFNILTYKTTLIILAVCAAICLFVFFRRLKAGKWRNLPIFSPAPLLLLLSAAVLFFMFTQRVIFKMSLGMPRNGVFLLPLVLISAGILMGWAADTLASVKILSLLLRSACLTLLAILCFLNLPSPRAVNIRPYDWGTQSLVGPLVRILRKIDPDQTWKIKLTHPYTGGCQRPIRYYKKFGFKIEYVEGDPYDLWICPELPPNIPVVYLEKQRFKDYHCAIVINTDELRNKRILYKMNR